MFSYLFPYYKFVFSREIEPIRCSIYIYTHIYIHIYIYIYPSSTYLSKESYLRNWLMWLWRLASPKSTKLVSGLQGKGTAHVKFKSKGHLLTYFLLAREMLVFIVGRTSADWMKQFHSRPTDLNANLKEKVLEEPGGWDREHYL